MFQHSENRTAAMFSAEQNQANFRGLFAREFLKADGLTDLVVTCKGKKEERNLLLCLVVSGCKQTYGQQIR